MTPEMQQEMSAMMSPTVIAGAVTWLVLQVIMIVFMIKQGPKKNRKAEEAIRRGHTVKAHIKGRVYRQDTWLDRHFDSGKRKRETFSCDYEYTVDGKRMIYRYIGYTSPPDPLTLYYIDDPRRAFPGNNINNYWRDMTGGMRYAVVFIIPVLFAAFVMAVIGGV